MRIGLNLLFLKPDKVGGTQIYSECLINAFARVGTKHEFVLFVNLKCENLFAGLPRNFLPVVCKIPAKIRPFRVIYEQIVLPLLIRKYCIEVLHSLGQTTPLISNCPSIITIHDVNYWICSNYFSLLERLLPQIFIKQALFAADNVIAVSSFLQNELIHRLGIQREKITVIYEGCPNSENEIENRINSEDIAILQQYNVVPPFLLTVASPWPHKNVSGLIAAYSELVRSGSVPKLVIIGTSVEHMPAVAIQLKSLGKNAHVIFTGHIAHRLLSAFYRNAEVFLFPSLGEGFGLPILEAMSYGLPVVSSNKASTARSRRRCCHPC